jgi:nucleotidyltransferase substrate binding protein (TIGR01987 family)
MSRIDYSPLGKAVQRLKEGLAALGRDPENTLYRDGVIQRFEFTYGLCASMLERYLAHEAPVQPDTKLTFPTLIRTASDMGVLRSGWDVWFGFREARNLTSHVYSEDTARKVLDKIPSFVEEAEYLCTQLERTAISGGN